MSYEMARKWNRVWEVSGDNTSLETIAQTLAILATYNALDDITTIRLRGFDVTTDSALKYKIGEILPAVGVESVPKVTRIGAGARLQLITVPAG